LPEWTSSSRNIKKSYASKYNNQKEIITSLLKVLFTIFLGTSSLQAASAEGPEKTRFATPHSQLSTSLGHQLRDCDMTIQDQFDDVHVQASQRCHAYHLAKEASFLPWVEVSLLL
jgi:hypothetical protein